MEDKKIENYLIPSVIATALLAALFPVGLVAIFYGLIAELKNNEGKIELANFYSKKAKTWCKYSYTIITIGIAVALIMLALGYQFGLAQKLQSCKII